MTFLTYFCRKAKYFFFKFPFDFLRTDRRYIRFLTETKIETANVRATRDVIVVKV